MPPNSVKSKDFHKHLLPDLPGPVKMRQLMVWAVQKIPAKKFAESLGECLLQGLLKNEVNTSWYGRPVNGGSEKRPNLQNVELLDTIAQVKQYQEQYNYLLKLCRLKNELAEWNKFEARNIVPTSEKLTDAHGESIVSALHQQSIQKTLQDTERWASNLPLSIDNLDWSLRLAATFAHKSKDFCEDIFRQIFDKFFASDTANPSIDPLLVLKALSCKSSNRRKSIKEHVYNRE